jgi:hypothetical protein
MNPRNPKTEVKQKEYEKIDSIIDQISDLSIEGKVNDLEGKPKDKFEVHTDWSSFRYIRNGSEFSQVEKNETGKSVSMAMAAFSSGKDRKPLSDEIMTIHWEESESDMILTVGYLFNIGKITLDKRGSTAFLGIKLPKAAYSDLINILNEDPTQIYTFLESVFIKDIRWKECVSMPKKLLVSNQPGFRALRINQLGYIAQANLETIIGDFRVIDVDAQIINDDLPNLEQLDPSTITARGLLETLKVLGFKAESNLPKGHPIFNKISDLREEIERLTASK